MTIQSYKNEQKQPLSNSFSFNNRQHDLGDVHIAL